MIGVPSFYSVRLSTLAFTLIQVLYNSHAFSNSTLCLPFIPSASQHLRFPQNARNPHHIVVSSRCPRHFLLRGPRFNFSFGLQAFLTHWGPDGINVRDRFSMEYKCQGIRVKSDTHDRTHLYECKNEEASSNWVWPLRIFFNRKCEIIPAAP
jgi:hypothetical protein